MSIWCSGLFIYFLRYYVFFYIVQTIVFNQINWFKILFQSKFVTQNIGYLWFNPSFRFWKGFLFKILWTYYYSPHIFLDLRIKPRMPINGLDLTRGLKLAVLVWRRSGSFHTRWGHHRKPWASPSAFEQSNLSTMNNYTSTKNHYTSSGFHKFLAFLFSYHHFLLIRDMESYLNFMPLGQVSYFYVYYTRRRVFNLTISSHLIFFLKFILTFDAYPCIYI